MLTCWISGVALKPNMCGGRTLWWLGMWWWYVVAAPKTEKGREACLPIERLQPRWEDGVGWWVGVPAVHVRLHRVDAGAAGSLAACCVACAVVSYVLSCLLALLQSLAQQALVVPVLLQRLVLVLVLQLRAGWPEPRLPLSLAVMPRTLGGGLSTGKG